MTPPRRRTSDAAERMARVTKSGRDDAAAIPAGQTPPPFAADLAADSPPHLEEQQPASPDVAPKRTAPKVGKVRTTVVLDVDEYDALREFCLQVERRTGRRGVASSEVVRVLLGLVRSDSPVSGLRERVMTEIETHGGNRRH